MKKKQHKRIVGWIALGVLGCLVVALVIAMTSVAGELAEQVVPKTADAVLAKAGIEEGKVVSVPVLYYDQKPDVCVSLYDMSMREALETRQFEWSSCGYHMKAIEQGLAEYELDDDYLPVAVNGKLTPNKGLDFARWFGAVDGKSASYTGTVGLRYSKDKATFEYDAEEFYPLDTVEFGKGDSGNSDGHNHLFTMSLAVPVTVVGSGDEAFEVTADDDTFVFVGNRLVIDMGGIHGATTGRFAIHENGEIYSGVDVEDLAYSGISVPRNENTVIRIFHADRDSSESVFGVKFSGLELAVTSTELADENGGVQVAYDPSDPTYVPPLGESMTVRPDSTKGLIIIMTVEGVAVIAVAVLVALVARYMVRREIVK